MKVSSNKGWTIIYVLLAVVLLAALGYAVARDGENSATNQLDESRAELLAAELIRYAASAELAVQQMEQWGATYDQILFDLPGSVGYSTNTNLQIYHPSGGGLAVFRADTNYYEQSSSHYNSSTGLGRGWRYENQSNMEWTKSTQPELSFSFLDVKREICEQINLQLYNDSSIPTANVLFSRVFDQSTGVLSDFMNADCPSCVNKKSFCIENNSNNTYGFYTILGAR